MFIPHIRVTFLAPAEVIKLEVAQQSCEEESNLACLICLCSKEFLVNTIISPRDDLTSTIRPYVPGETIGHWTVKSYLWLHRLSKEYSTIVWLGPLIAQKCWNSISSLFCMFISYFLHSLFAFSLVYFPKKKKKREKCFLIYNPLMKLSSVLFRKSLHLSLYLLSYEYVCANCLMFPCIFSIL